MAKSKLKLENLRKLIEEDNHNFRKLKVSDKIIAIAKDALIRINLTGFKPNQGHLFIFYTVVGSLSLKDYVNTDPHCKCCAKGALFLSYVGRVNEMTRGQLKNDPELDSNEMEKLQEIFDGDQLDLMEIAFEGAKITKTADDLPEELIIDAVKFHRRYSNSFNTLSAICCNLIINEGRFIPSHLLKLTEIKKMTKEIIKEYENAARIEDKAIKG